MLDNQNQLNQTDTLSVSSNSKRMKISHSPPPRPPENHVFDVPPFHFERRYLSETEVNRCAEMSDLHLRERIAPSDPNQTPVPLLSATHCKYNPLCDSDGRAYINVLVEEQIPMKGHYLSQDDIDQINRLEEEHIQTELAKGRQLLSITHGYCSNSIRADENGRVFRYVPDTD